ncbi:hypothetical protein [Paramicrobacterium fandaimingii]|uniref:hypothetical protein n=1 Tax=Paramicrobacterium fandaimingii TaxID=2708079 RepID=UPI00141FA26C|nr:hypothetical protein [Microbacterium fandaimingii]
MTTKRFQLDGTSIDELRARIRREHGDRARIISLEKVTVGGIAGFLTRHKYEATVDVPFDGDGDVDAPIRPGKQGIEMLIADAEEAEQTLGYSVATSGTSFDSIMQSLQAQIRTTPREEVPEPSPAVRPLQLSAVPTPRALPAAHHEAAAPEPEIEPLSSAGDLVVFIGLGTLALDAAREARGLLAAAGDSMPRGIRPVTDRRAAYLARADAVEENVPVNLAWRLSSALAVSSELDELARLQPDQTWIVVDARHKADDTERWAQLVSQSIRVDAMLVIAENLTATPATVTQLGIPRGHIPPARSRERTESAGTVASAETIG